MNIETFRAEHYHCPKQLPFPRARRAESGIRGGRC